MVVLSLAACGRDETDLSNGKAQFVQKCGSCHELSRAGTQGQTGPSLDAAFRAALQAGMNRDTDRGRGPPPDRERAPQQRDAREPRHGRTTPSDVAAYVAYATGKTGEDSGALAQAGPGGRHHRRADLHRRRLRAAATSSARRAPPATSGRASTSWPRAAGKREPGKSAEQYVHESIVDPEAYTVSGFGKGVMPSYEGKLTDKQLDALVQYLLGK